MLFINREDAGRKLAAKLAHYKDGNTVVVALPRGGVPVGYEISKLLELPLQILISRKIGSPFNPEFGIGAIASGGAIFIDQLSAIHLGISQLQIAELTGKEKAILEHREHLYGVDKKKLQLKNKTVILVDDGLATGVTARAAILAIMKQKPQKIVFAVPVCPKELIKTFSTLVAEFIYLESPDNFNAVGEMYTDFHPVTDEEVISLLEKRNEVSFSK